MERDVWLQLHQPAAVTTQEIGCSCTNLQAAITTNTCVTLVGPQSSYGTCCCVHAVVYVVKLPVHESNTLVTCRLHATSGQVGKSASPSQPHSDPALACLGPKTLSLNPRNPKPLTCQPGPGQCPVVGLQWR